jgi:hypothetical protein
MIGKRSSFTSSTKLLATCPRSGGQGAETGDGDEECPGGNARVRWRSADAEAVAGRRGGAGGHREIHAGSISGTNG